MDNLRNFHMWGDKEEFDYVVYIVGDKGDVAFKVDTTMGITFKKEEANKYETQDLALSTIPKDFRDHWKVGIMIYHCEECGEWFGGCICKDVNND